LIPLFAVKSDGVRLAMSCICGFATIATLIVAALRFAEAVAASRAATAATTVRATGSAHRIRTLLLGGLRICTASSRTDDAGVN
jgi:hypothetical protein